VFLGQGVQRLLENKDEGPISGAWAGAAEEDPTYTLLLQCNQLAVDIDNEIVNMHNYMKDKYKVKFPELASFVHDSVQYAKTVQAVKNEMDLTKVHLEDVLPQVSAGHTPHMNQASMLCGSMPRRWNAVKNEMLINSWMYFLTEKGGA
jgi:RNA processing factor Prp31